MFQSLKSLARVASVSDLRKKILFVVFLVLFLVGLLFNAFGRRGPP